MIAQLRHGRFKKAANDKVFGCNKKLFQIYTTYAQLGGYMLLVKNGPQLNIPKDFVSLEPDNGNAHQCDDFYTLKAQAALRWIDPDIGIELPLKCNPTLSEEGSIAPLLKDFESPSIFGGNA